MKNEITKTQYEWLLANNYNDQTKRIGPIVVGGSIDNLTGGSITGCVNGRVTVAGGPQQPLVIVDYKTTSMRAGSLKDKPIKYAYRLQLLVYAWVLRKQGVDVSDLRIRLVYITTNDVNRVSEKTGKPLQDYPTTIVLQTEQITEQELEMIGDMIHLIAESVDTWNKHPELRYLLAKDYRLKVK